jgi:hypothetical protein
MLECKICNYKTDRMANYKIHLNTKKHIKNIQSNKNNIENSLANNLCKNKYLCELCNRDFNKKCNLIRHKLSHKNINDTEKIINKVDDIIIKTNQHNQRIEKKIDKAVKSASAIIRYLLEH